MSSFAAGTLRRMVPCSLASFWMVMPSRDRVAVLGAACMLNGNAWHWDSLTSRTLPTRKEPSYTTPSFRTSGTNSTTVGLSQRSLPASLGLNWNRPSVCLSIGTGDASSTRTAVPSDSTPPV